MEHNGIRLVKEAQDYVTDIGAQRLDDNNTASGGSIVFRTKYNYSVKPAFTVVELRSDSPAEKAGIEIGDVILTINSKDTSNYSLQEITQFFYEKSGKTIRLKIDRNGRRMNFQFQLEDLLN